MEYSVYEMKKLSDLDDAVSKSNNVVYKKDIANNEIAKFTRTITEDKKNTTKTVAVIVKSNNQIQLILDDKLVEMTAPIFTECQKLLFKHQTSGKTRTDMYPGLSAQDIIATEQKRDVYNTVKSPYKRINAVNAPRPDILLIDDKDNIYEDGYFGLKELFIMGVDKKQINKTRRLFLRDLDNKFYLDYGVSKSEDGLYSIVIGNGRGYKLKTFDFFHNEYSAYRFRCMLTGKAVMPLYQNDVPRIFIKCKIR